LLKAIGLLDGETNDVDALEINTACQDANLEQYFTSKGNWVHERMCCQKMH
jgi:hypothetical protein